MLNYSCCVSKTTIATQTKRTKPEQRKVVQVTLRPSVYGIALRHADEQDTFPGRVIEHALLMLDAEKTAQGQDKGATS